MAAVVKGLGIPLSFLRTQKEGPGAGPEDHVMAMPSTPATEHPPEIVSTNHIKSVLVAGGSSCVGSCAIQLLRIALGSEVTILSTNSRNNNPHILKLGATACIARNDPKLIDAVKEASPGGQGVDAILDAVGAAGENKQLFDALRPDGPKLYSEVMTGTKIDVPKGIKSTVVFGRMALQMRGGTTAMGKLADLVDEGKFKLPLAVEVVGNGLEAVGSGVEKLKAGGVSATKLVVSL